MSRIADAGVGAGELVVRIDGGQPLSAEPVAAIGTICDQAERQGGDGRVIVHVSGSPQGPSAPGLTVALVSKWERALRRLERLPVATTAVAAGDCGGLALDALLATDYRIADPSVRLLVRVQDGATWPGMGLFRLAHQAGAGAIRRAMLFGIPIDARRSAGPGPDRRVSRRHGRSPGRGGQPDRGHLRRRTGDQAAADARRADHEFRGRARRSPGGL